MAISVFDIFKIGIGPSSSHTVGPMKAAREFALKLEKNSLFECISRLSVELYGSLGATGKGHGTDKAVLLGLEGEMPDLIDPAIIPSRLERIRASGSLRLLGRVPVEFNEKSGLVFHRKALPLHPNGMRFSAFDAEGAALLQADYYSGGGGFVVTDENMASGLLSENATSLPYPFKSAEALLNLCAKHTKPISELMLQNEKAYQGEQEIRHKLLHIWQVMQDCVENGLHQEGVMPGGMKVKRRAANLYRQLTGAIPRQTPWGTGRHAGLGQSCSPCRSAKRMPAAAGW